MPIEVLRVDGGLTKVQLGGRINIAGTQEIDMPMSAVGGTGRVVLLSPVPAIEEVIRTTGVDELIPFSTRSVWRRRR